MGAILTPKGMYRDQLTAPDGSVIFDSGWKPNTIVDRCRILLAAFVRNDNSDGILHLQVGSGKAAWDTTGAPVPLPNATELVTPAADPPIAFANLQVAYMDDNGTTLPAGDPPTPQLHITATLPPGYPAPVGGPTYELREFGLFGSLNGAPFMINNVHHTVIVKEAAITLTRIVRLYF